MSRGGEMVFESVIFLVEKKKVLVEISFLDEILSELNNIFQKDFQIKKCQKIYTLKLFWKIFDGNVVKKSINTKIIQLLQKNSGNWQTFKNCWRCSGNIWKLVEYLPKDEIKENFWCTVKFELSQKINKYLQFYQ